MAPPAPKSRDVDAGQRKGQWNFVGKGTSRTGYSFFVLSSPSSEIFSFGENGLAFLRENQPRQSDATQLNPFAAMMSHELNRPVIVSVKYDILKPFHVPCRISTSKDFRENVQY